MKKNLFIYLTAFFCGMSVMAVELSASRMLATTYSSSSIVWTIVIGLIMISLSIGNVLGGRAADKHNSMKKLYSMIWLASIWIAIIPLIGKYVLDLSAIVMGLIMPDNMIIAGSVTSCLIIFSIPLVILGMVSPYLVKLGATDMSHNGKATGNIYALSTFGSIIGTFLPTFLTIPLIGTGRTFFVFALALNLLCLYFFIRDRSRLIRTIISTLLILAMNIIPFNMSYAFWEKNKVYEGESQYNYLLVKNDGDSTILSTNVAFGVQSIYKKGHELSGYYYEYALMAPFFRKNTDFNSNLKVLVLGLGTGTFTKQCSYFFPRSNSDGVEIDGKIVDLAKKYFDFKDSEARVFINDGRTFLKTREAGKYDVIFIDAFHDITIPFHMATREFFMEVKKHLNRNGVIVLNINIHSNKNSELMDYLTQTLKSTVNKAYKFDIDGLTNTIVVASDNMECLNDYNENIRKIDIDHPLYEISRYVQGKTNEITDSKFIFTDDKAPVEIMGQKVLNEVVADELQYFKERIKASGGGLKGLFDAISGS